VQVVAGRALQERKGEALRILFCLKGQNGSLLVDTQSGMRECRKFSLAAGGGPPPTPQWGLRHEEHFKWGVTRRSLPYSQTAKGSPRGLASGAGKRPQKDGVGGTCDGRGVAGFEGRKPEGRREEVMLGCAVPRGEQGARVGTRRIRFAEDGAVF